MIPVLQHIQNHLMLCRIVIVVGTGNPHKQGGQSCTGVFGLKIGTGVGNGEEVYQSLKHALQLGSALRTGKGKRAGIVPGAFTYMSITSTTIWVSAISLLPS